MALEASSHDLPGAAPAVGVVRERRYEATVLVAAVDGWL